MDLPWGLKPFDVILLTVTFIAPMAAVQAQKWIERYREKRRGKDYIFRTLMATRAAKLSADHVRALNMIDLEYYGNGAREKRVRSTWKAYRDHLSTKFDDKSQVAWNIKADEIFIRLLYDMARSLNYEFDETDIKTGCYSPVAHGTLETEDILIRRGLVEILTGQRSLQVDTQVASSEDQLARQEEIQTLLLECLRGTRPYAVQIVNATTLTPPAVPAPAPLELEGPQLSPGEAPR